MINETMYGLGNAPSAIRELFAYGLERKAQIGEDKVFDFSIGNPSVPAPDKVAKTMHELADMPPAQLHAYSPASGLDETKTAIADNLNRRFGTDYAATSHAQIPQLRWELKRNRCGRPEGKGTSTRNSTPRCCRR